MMNRPSERAAAPQFGRAPLRPLTQNATATSCSSCGDDQPEQAAADAERAANTTRYSWLISGMDCPSCARKVETAITSLPGVVKSYVSFASEKLVVDAQEDVRPAVEAAVQSAGYSVRTLDAPAAPSISFWRKNAPLFGLALLMLASWLIARTVSPQFGQLAFIVTTLVGLWPVATQAVRLIRSGNPFAIETLMSAAAIGALCIGASAEAAMVLLLFLVGERLEGWAAHRARRSISALVALKPETATRLRDGKQEIVALSALRPGDVMLVAAGSRLPADGRLRSASASFDESAITGESLPVARSAGDSVPAGATSVDRLVELEVISQPGDSAVDRILRLIEEAEERRAPVERFIDKFSRIYTPLIMLAALLVMVLPPLLFGQLWQPWIYKGLTLLLIGCPCALVISTPAAITSGLAAAARRGTLIKGGAALEQLSRMRQVAFDKTGTLTTGTPQVVAISARVENEETLLTLAAAVEQGATHPLAQAIVKAAQARGIAIPVATDQRTLAGSGIVARVDGRDILLSAPDKLPSGLLDEAWQTAIHAEQARGQTVVVLLRDGQPLGTLALRDTLRDDAREAIAALAALNVSGTILTGDNPRAARAIADELGLSFRAGLLPADKVAAVNALNATAPLAMVGDGINDAPAMKAASIGVAMGSGTDVALETADAALTHSRLTELPRTIALARATHAIIRQNITIALGLKAIFLITTLLDFTGLWLAVLADTGATVLVTANALRLLRHRA